MKALVCDLCGGNDIIKQDGCFVCQHCGTKYSVEEARKMMIDGVVDVQGTVTVDNSAYVEKYLANARRAKAKEDWEETEKYYNLVEQNDPDKWIAEEEKELEALRNRLIDAYWAEHTDEKAALESEKETLEKQVSENRGFIDSLYETIELKNIENQIASKSKQRDSLSVFKGKEKKALQAEIDSLNERLIDAKAKQEPAAKQYVDQIENLQKRISEIETELTKNRD